MSVRFLHLLPKQLGLNGETGNLDCLVQRLRWAGVESEIQVFDGNGPLPAEPAAVFIGSGTLAGALEALEALRPEAQNLLRLAETGVPFFALGLGWEILGQSIVLTDGREIDGIGIFPSRSQRTTGRASAESFGFDEHGNLSTGYTNHSSEIELLRGANALLQLREGYGNSSLESAKSRPDEGLVFENLMAARLNGPLFPLNPHLADRFLDVVVNRLGLSYKQTSQLAKEVDGFALNAREELRKRLAS
jgi:CobQ-like glutamine amidotransferase family enzyme